MSDSEQQTTVPGHQFATLIRMDSPAAVLEEVQVILKRISPDFDTQPVLLACNTTVDLFNGNYPGYRACNTEYHDLRHTTDAFLSMARLVHGAVVDGNNFSDRQIILGLIAALFHDAGYIQEEHDTEGTGAKHTRNHVQRSMDFVKQSGPEHGLTDAEIAAAQTMILCTEFTVDISAVEFRGAEIELLGKMLGTADLLAQTADRTYLEKLLFLYREFKEAGIGDYQSEVDLLKKTIGFYDFIARRIATTLDATDRFMQSHFASRWNINQNLYQQAIEKQRDYLQKILKIPDSDPRDHLKRDGIVNKIRRQDTESTIHAQKS